MVISFKYFLSIFCFIFILKSAFRGFTSEAISLIATIISSFLGISLYIYKPNTKNLCLSIAIYLIIQSIGSYIAINNKRYGLFQFLGGMVLGFVKFVLLLIFVLYIINQNPNLYPFPQAFLESDIVKFILPYVNAISDLVSKFF